MISAGLFVLIVAAAVTGLVLLTMKLQKENSDFIDDLMFKLRHRTISHNQVKAQLAVMKTRFAQLELENANLKQKVVAEETATDAPFSGLLGEAEFVEARNQKIEALEKAIVELKNMHITDLAS